MSESYVYASDSCLTEFQGQPVQVVRGQAWGSEDPFVKARPDLFRDPDSVRRTPGYTGPKRRVSRETEPRIETVTAAPGERRGTTQRRETI